MRSHADQQWLIKLGNRLRKAREEKIVTQFPSASRAWMHITYSTGISRQQFINYENAIQEPKLSWLMRLCETYKIDLYWLVYGKPIATFAKELAGLVRERKPYTDVHQNDVDMKEEDISDASTGPLEILHTGV